MVLKQAPRPDELRLSFPKLRWWQGAEPKPLILGKVYNTAGFEVLSEEGETRGVEELVLDLLKDGRWRTADEIASGKKGGIGKSECDSVSVWAQSEAEVGAYACRYRP
jgi:hypothetical protein